MEFRGQEDEAAGYNSPPIRLSAFSKPTLSPSSSLVFSPRGLAGGNSAASAAGGGGLTVSTQAASRNGSSLLETTMKHVKHAGGDSDLPNSRPITGRSATGTRYKECLKNHAASSGRHVVDGCGEFMAVGGEGTPEALKCAACGCHRSFHRKVTDADSYSGALPPPPPPPPHGSSPQPLLLGAPPHRQLQTPPTFPPGFPHSPIGFNQSGGTQTESSSEELNALGAAAAGEVGTSSKRGAVAAAEGGRKKRFRTKFTPEQKLKMIEFADSVGWRILRQDEAAVERFCNETGVRRQVLKVWMHNNKHTLRKDHQETTAAPPQQHDQHQNPPS